MQHELLFQNPVFQQGINVTVRNGDKWMKVNIGDELVIKETGKDEVIVSGKVIGKALLPASLCPTELLFYEHDPNCRCVSGLIKVMENIYPNFAPNNLVTIIIFEL